MLLMLRHHGDEVAESIASTWRQACPHVPVIELDSTDLATGVGWTYHHPVHRATSLRLPGGNLVLVDQLVGVVNRLRYIDAPPFPNDEDRNYAGSELFALAVAFMASLECAVVNPVRPSGFAATGRSRLDLLRAAVSIGLGVQRLRLVAGGRPRTAGWAAYEAPSDRHAPLGAPLDPALPMGTRPARLFETLTTPYEVEIAGETCIGSPTPELTRLLVRAAKALDLTLATASVGWSADRDAWVLSDIDGLPDRLRPETVHCLVEQLATGRLGTSPLHTVPAQESAT